MEKPFNIFISWSVARSHSAAEFLHKWLPKVIQTAKPWLSTDDIEKGSRSQDEIAKVLKCSKFGIICLTPENREKPWVLFEAGALSKAFDDRARVCTYLLGGLEPKDVTQPLGLFQATRADKHDTRKLLHTINAAVSDEAIREEDLNELFDAMWPKLEEALNKLPPADEATPPTRQIEDMVAEILEITRAGAATTNLDDLMRAIEGLYSKTISVSYLGGMPTVMPPSVRNLGLVGSMTRGLEGLAVPGVGPQGPTPPPEPVALNGPAGPTPAPTPVGVEKPK